MALHHKEVMMMFHQVPVTMLVEQPHTRKTFIAKSAACLLGVHKTSVFTDLSMARGADLLGKSIFFVFNDPDKADVLNNMICKAFEEGITSNFVREVEPNTSPVITANAFVVRGIRAYGMREISRVVILPLNEQAEESNVQVEEEMAMASRGLADMVSLGRKVSSRWALDKVNTFMAGLVPLLPTCDAANRVAKK